VSHSHRGSRHGVRDTSPNPPIDLFFLKCIMMVQHQGTPESTTEMAPRHHHFHVCFVDCVLDRVGRPHLCTRRLVEQQYQGMLRPGQRFRLHCPYDGGTSAATAADV
jgi:hypothetical protein